MDLDTLFCVSYFYLFPQQRKLMGSSAQISSGVCRCGSQEQVPEEGSGSFWRVPAGVGVGSGGRFRKVLENSGGRFRKVPESFGAGWCRLRRQVPEGFRACWCRFRRQGSEGSREFRRGNLDRSSHVIVCFEHWLVITLSKWAKPLRKKIVHVYSQTWHKDSYIYIYDMCDTAVGDTTKAYYLLAQNPRDVLRPWRLEHRKVQGARLPMRQQPCKRKMKRPSDSKVFFWYLFIYWLCDRDLAQFSGFGV